MLPSVSLLVPLKSSSLVIVREWFPSDGATGIFDEVDCMGLEAKEEVDGSSGLHGECEPADVLDDAANGTPDVE